MSDLDSDVKLFITQQLGAWAKPIALIKQVLDIFGVAVTKQQMQAYDPRTEAGKRLSPELKDAFWAARKAANETGLHLAITERGFRLRKLQDLLDDEQRGMSPKVVVDVLTLYEKTEGGMFKARENGATDDEVDAQITDMATKLKRAVLASVTNPQEAERAFKAIDKELARESESGST